MKPANHHFDQAASNWDDEPRRVALMKAIGGKIIERTAPTESMDVLDYGCGTGLIGLFLLPHVRSVTGADNSPGMLEVLRQKIADSEVENMKAVPLDLEQDSPPEECYHRIVAGMVMHHVANLERVLGAFFQILTPGGTLCLADLDTEPGTFHPPEVAEIVHHHGFDRETLKKQLMTLGFVEVEDTTVATFRKPVAGGGEEEFSIFLITARRQQTESDGATIS